MKWYQNSLQLVVFFLCGIFLPAQPCTARDASGQKEVSSMRIVLDEYRKEKYRVLGPVQYLGREAGTIELFRYGRIPYRIFDAKEENGDQCYPEQSDYVYVVSKDGHIVLLCVSQEGRNVK